MTTKPRFLRVDDRLIHGQVIVGWLPHLEATHIVVVNDRVAADPVRQEMMALSVPDGVELHCHATGEIAAMTEHPWEESLVLVMSPRDALACLEAGLSPQVLNIGGMHARSGKEEIFEALHIDNTDRQALMRMIELGFDPVFQPTPQNDPVSLADVLT